jgi:hypothetical protein
LTASSTRPPRSRWRASFALDGNFAANLSRVFGEPLAATPLGIWEVTIAAVLAALIVAAFVRDGRRR